MGNKIEIGRAALMMRINRHLKQDVRRLHAARGDRMINSVGRYYLVDTSNQTIVETKVDPEAFARREGILKPYEVATGL
jgi:hypothetical protein